MNTDDRFARARRDQAARIAAATSHDITVSAFNAGGGPPATLQFSCTCSWAGGMATSMGLDELNRFARAHIPDGGGSPS